MKHNSKIMTLLKNVTDLVNTEYQNRRKVLSFEEYLLLFEKRPLSNLRDAAKYMLDAIDYFGKEKIQYSWGEATRYKIFDQKFSDSTNQLIGQERAQKQIRTALAAQVRDGKPSRLLLIHGPNGSAKSTIINCLFSGLDHYSRKEEGELYRFRWIFPTRKTQTGTVGFGGRLKRDKLESFAYLEDEQIDATLECEFRDHPLLLIPKDARRQIIEQTLSKAGITDYQIPDYLLHASLCHRCRQVADSLMRTHNGDLRKVLAHVQVEPWAMSRRYRRGLVKVYPQASTDANQRQITADRSLAALPIELQNMTLFETFGSLVDASNGVLEFEDMLKRPIDAYKYLLGTIETGEVSLSQSIIKLNTVIMATTNDVMLQAFREHHEYQSFRERLTLISVPYLTEKSIEKKIYQLQLIPHIKRHVAPHAVDAAAQFAILSRLHKPNHDLYKKEFRMLIKEMTVDQKCKLYDESSVPAGLSDEESAMLLDSIADMAKETANIWEYEGRYGASPRTIRQILLSASLLDKYRCLSPFGVLDELTKLCTKVREYPFLEREKEIGGYHDHSGFILIIENNILDKIEKETRLCSGLIEEYKPLELFETYINNVRHWTDGEKIVDETTGVYRDFDEAMMGKIEKDIGINKDDVEKYRKNTIDIIAGWAIEHPGQKLLLTTVLPDLLEKIEDAYFDKNKRQVTNAILIALQILEKNSKNLDTEQLKNGQKLIKKMFANYNYCEQCLKEALARLMKKRFLKK